MRETIEKRDIVQEPATRWLSVARVAKPAPRLLARGSLTSENHRMDFITFGGRLVK